VPRIAPQPTPDGLALLLDLISDPLVAAQLMYTGLDQRLLAFASEVRGGVRARARGSLFFVRRVHSGAASRGLPPRGCCCARAPRARAPRCRRRG
jgi:hypothetical protein